MRRIVEYKTIVTYNTKELAEKVNDSLKSGWEPFGNQYFRDYKQGYDISAQFFQPMIRYDEVNENNRLDEIV